MQIGKFSRLAVVPLALGLIIAAPGQDAFAKSKQGKRSSHACGMTRAMNVTCTLACDGSFKTLSKALKSAGLARTLEGRGPFTLFAPEDKAFWKQPKGFMEDLKQDPKRLKSVLAYHVLPRKLASSDLVNMRAAKTVQGEAVMLDAKGGNVEVDGALVTKADIKCSNGVIHIIDDVLTPDRGK